MRSYYYPVFACLYVCRWQLARVLVQLITSADGNIFNNAVDVISLGAALSEASSVSR